MHVFMPDHWHFHRRNFAALFDDLHAHAIPYSISRERRSWWKRHGDYEPLAPLLDTDVARLAAMPPEDIATATEAGISLLGAAHNEFLCRVLPQPRWRDGFGDNGIEAVARHAFSDQGDRRTLILNLAAAADWARYWRGYFQSHPHITHVLAFSGAYIYTQTMLQVAHAMGKRCFVLETFFTGNEFYLEERTAPLPNASTLSHAPQSWPSDASSADRLRVGAHARLSAMRNKNVQAVGGDLVRYFPDTGSGPRVLVVGQVLNDFSLTNTALTEGSSLAFYRRLIQSLLSAGCRVIFKAHPWERKRPNLLSPLTLNSLVQTFGPDHPRVRFIERDPIGHVFAQVDHVAGLCSQGLMEACQAGFKPLQFGQAFYGGRGFTYDCSQNDAEAVAASLATGALPGRLTLDEYRIFENFLASALMIHLLPSHGARRGLIAARLGLAAAPDAAAVNGGGEWSSSQGSKATLPGKGQRLWMYAREIATAPQPWVRDALYLIHRKLGRR